ncbi:hypothetical protein Veis_1059 [Verminephrobacter eiseniae EF01-2]|uniref:Methyl-accepting chemotaxis sensory transducer n=1 Tax=Verminephrobacter eiseniae (strain EF01-2) TaxID=391735 RepID=A1WGS8_VEREI|nr:hypothetical protein Veis_1059 [Verminephrobacter eiseniae EF01-2]
MASADRQMIGDATLAQRSAAAAASEGLIHDSVSAVDGGVRHVQDAGAVMKEIVAGVQRVGDIIGAQIQTG